jgi:hypothetical protein
MDIYECVNDSIETHILSEPIALSCGHCVCRECIHQNSPIFCNKCKLTNTNDLANSKVSFAMQELLKLNREMIFKSQKLALEKKLTSFRVRKICFD